MTNEMMRPCTLWGYTFDACEVIDLDKENPKSLLSHVGVYVKNNKLLHEFYTQNVKDYDSCVAFSPASLSADVALLEAITTIADALNAPVLATEEVLAGLPKDAKAFILVKHESHGIHTQMKCFLYWGFKDKKEGWMYREHDLDSLDGESCDYMVSKIDKLYADDPKTAKYLRQFTLEGVRRVS